MSEPLESGCGHAIVEEPVWRRQLPATLFFPATLFWGSPPAAAVISVVIAMIVGIGGRRTVTVGRLAVTAIIFNGIIAMVGAAIGGLLIQDTTGVRVAAAIGWGFTALLVHIGLVLGIACLRSAIA